MHKSLDSDWDILEFQYYKIQNNPTKFKEIRKYLIGFHKLEL